MEGRCYSGLPAPDPLLLASHANDVTFSGRVWVSVWKDMISVKPIASGAFLSAGVWTKFYNKAITKKNGFLVICNVPFLELHVSYMDEYYLSKLTEEHTRDLYIFPYIKLCLNIQKRKKNKYEGN